MFEFNNQIYAYRSDISANDHYEQAYQTRTYIYAKSLFENVVNRGKIYRFWAAVFHRPKSLLDLETVKSNLHVENVHYCGLKEVPLKQIIGTEQSSSRFDLAFHPADVKSRQRWVGVAMAFLSPVSLPPVELTRVGDAYFVRDGHHRISVVHALKQDFIEANVVNWKYTWRHSPEAAVNFLDYRLNNA
jgi:hypothetical protein